MSTAAGGNRNWRVKTNEVDKKQSDRVRTGMRRLLLCTRVRALHRASATCALAREQMCTCAFLHARVWACEQVGRFVCLDACA
eukprot:4162431-Pleurochrysis_carterae.AAC.1